MLVEELQKLDLGAMVHLYTIDATKLGGTIYRFSNSTLSGELIRFRGEVYPPADFQAEGFETSSGGSLPQPVIRIANTTRAIAGAVNQYNDLVGAKVTRIRTFAKFLDGEAEADENSAFKPDIFFVEQKAAQNRRYIEFRLSSALDIEGQKLPARVVSATYCARVYRRWVGDLETGGFVLGTCPYVGEAMFDSDDKRVSNPLLDRCSKHLGGCEKRYPGEVLPAWIFPGAGRFDS